MTARTAILFVLCISIALVACSDDEDNPVDSTPGPLRGNWEITYHQNGSVVILDTVAISHIGKSVSFVHEFFEDDYLEWSGTTDDNIHVSFTTVYVETSAGTRESLTVNAEFASTADSFESEVIERRDENNNLLARFWFTGKRVE